MAKLNPKIRGKVVKGRFYPFEQEIYDIVLDKLDGKIAELSIKEYKKERTNDQNKYYFGCIVKLISEDTGYTEEETHELLKAMFLKKVVELKGKKYIIIKSSTSLKTDEFSEYVNKCKQWAATQGLFIPEPNEII